MGTPVEAPGSDFTWSSSDMYSGDKYYNPGANIVITMPAASENVDFTVWHVGASNTITIDLPGGTDLCILSTGEQARIRTYLDTSNVPQYQTVTAYTPTNVTTDRSYDANATTLDEIADVLGTLIADLKKRGLLD